MLKYDVINSDIRYRYGFRDSYSCLDKEDVQKTYIDWFKRSAGEIFYGLKVLDSSEPKFECDLSEFPFEFVNVDGVKSSQPLVSVFEQSSYSYDSAQSYEPDPEYENLDLLCRAWELEGLEDNDDFKKVLRRFKIDSKIKFSTLYNKCDFAKQYEKAIFFHSLNKLDIETLESEKYMCSTFQTESLSFYFKRAVTVSPIRLSNVLQN